MTVSLPYPNPARGGQPVRVRLTSNCPTKVRWSVVSVAYRKVFESELTVSRATDVLWDLRDKGGRPVANGLYYLVFTPEGQPAVLLREIVVR